MNSRQLTTVAAMLALAACSRPAAPPGRATAALATATVATFEGSYRPGQGLTIRTAPTGSLAVQGRVAYSPWQDGVPGSGPVDTFELVTVRDATLGPNDSGCGPSSPSYDANITLRSFFKTLSFTDVAIELTYVSTDYEACLDDTPGASSGMSGLLGFWDYGPIGVAGTGTDHATRLWQFRFGGGQAFTFTGRIMAEAAPLAVPANGVAAFEWVPSMLLDPPHSFQHVPTTLSHVVWDGLTGFTDTVGTLTFQRTGSPGFTTIGLSYPRQAYATGFSASDYYVADAAHGGNSFDTTGDFTVCAKFKPGANPPDGGFKVLVGKGNPVDEAGTGWALAHFRLGIEPEYSLVYRTGVDGDATRAIVGPQSPTPDQRAYDYVCGGRVGGDIYLDAFGQMFGNAVPVQGNILGAASLPIVIGAAAGGAYPDSDGGVYEVIWDSRPISADVAGQIIAAAEGRATRNGAYWTGFITDGPTVPGADLAGYLLPRGAGVPLTNDGSGLLDAGTQLTFNQVLQPNPAGGYCIGAEVAAADWSAVSGGVLGENDGGQLKIWFEADLDGHLYVQGTNGNAYRARGPAVEGWAAGSRHTFKVCATPHGTGENVSLYVDSSATPWNNTSGQALVDLSSTPLRVGTGGTGPALSGARIGRVFACPTPTAASCNAAVVSPSGLAYSVNPAVYTAGVAITANTPSSSGGAATTYSVSPSLPAGLSLNTSTGVVAGTPTAVTATASYTVTAGNSAGTTTAGLTITVNSSSPVMRLAASTWLNYVNVATMTTPTFSSQGAQRVWVAVVSWYPPFDDPAPTSVGWVGGTPAGEASDWQMVVRSYDGTVHWCSEIWWATSTQQLTNASVIATRSGVTSQNNSTGILSVYEVSGARTTWGAAAEHHSPMSEVSQNIRTNVVEVPITATASDSLIVGISQYGDFYSTSVANAWTTIDYQQHDGGGDGGAAAWHKTTATVADTSYMLGVTLPAAQGDTRAFSGCAVEVLAP